MPALSAPLTFSVVPVSFREKLPPVELNAPRLLMALVAAVRSVAPVAPPVSVPAVMTPAAPWPMLTALRLTVCVPASSAPVTLSAAASLKAKLPPVELNAPRFATVLFAVPRLVAPVELPVSVPAVMTPAAPWVMLPAVRDTVLAPALRAPETLSALAPSLRVKLPPAELNAPTLPIAFVAVPRLVVPVELPVSVPAVITPAALWPMLAAVRLTVLAPALSAPVTPSAVPASFRLKLPPLVNAPTWAIALVAVDRFVAPTVLPLRVSAVTTPATDCVMLPALRLTLFAPALSALARLSAVLPSFRVKSPPNVVAPRLAMALFAVPRLIVPVEDALSVPAVITPPGVCAMLEALRLTVLAPALSAPVTLSAAPMSLSEKLPPLVNAPTWAIALFAPVRFVAPTVLPLSVSAVITPPAVCERLPAFSVTLFAPALIALVSASAVVPSFKAKLPLNDTAPRLTIALVPVVRSMTPEVFAFRVPAVIDPPAV